jgi:hypothetical protein
MRGRGCVVCVCVSQLACCLAAAAPAGFDCSLNTHRFGREVARKQSLQRPVMVASRMKPYVLHTPCVTAASRADLAALDVVNRFSKKCSYLRKQMCSTAVTRPRGLTFRCNLCAHTLRFLSLFCAALQQFQNSENLRQQASSLKRRPWAELQSAVWRARRMQRNYPSASVRFSPDSAPLSFCFCLCPVACCFSEAWSLQLQQPGRTELQATQLRG